MKVDLGQCAICGAKNSKYVEKCYKCGATLPWAPAHVAPRNTPQSGAPVVPDDAKTVVVRPSDAPVAPAETAAKPSATKRAQSKVAVPVWALLAGGLGSLVLGMALWPILNGTASQTVVVVPTPSALTPALAPIVPAASATPALAATPGESPTFAPIAPEIFAQPTAAATPAVSATAALAIGPNFDELYANLTTNTPQQQALYWEFVKGKKISWRGEFVSLGNAVAGPLVVNCRAAKGAFKIVVNLDEAMPQTLPQYKIGDSVPFAGVLQSRDVTGITVVGGRTG